MCNAKKEVLSITLLFCFLVSIFTNSVYAVGDIESAVFDSSDQMLPTPEQLVLSSEDVPKVINFSDAQEKGHILRLREKEPDDKFDRAYELNIPQNSWASDAADVAVLIYEDESEHIQ